MQKYKIADTLWSFNFIEDHKKLFKKFETKTTDNPIHSIEFYEVDDFNEEPNLKEIKDSLGKTIIKIKYLTTQTIFYVLSSLKNKKRYEYELSLLRFGEVMKEHGYLLLRASCVSVSGGALLVLGNKKAGKTNFIKTWLSQFKTSEFVSDDTILVKPNKLGGFIYSSPFTGSMPVSKDYEIPVNGLLILERGINNQFVDLKEMDKLVKAACRLHIYDSMDIKQKVINYCFSLIETTTVVKYSGHINEIEIRKIFNKLYLN